MDIRNYKAMNPSYTPINSDMKPNRELIPERPESHIDEIKRLLGDIMVVVRDKHSESVLANTILMHLRKADIAFNELRLGEIWPEGNAQ